MTFIKGVRYVAELMEPNDGDIYLCGDSGSITHDYSSSSSSVEDYREETIQSASSQHDNDYHYTPSLTEGGAIIPGA